MKKKILFVIGNSSVEPLGIGYLAARLTSNSDFQLDCFRSNPSDLLNLYNFLRTMHTFKPDIVALSMTTGQHLSLLKLAEELKFGFPNVVTIIGGSHPTYFPYVIDLPYIDYVIRGEADITFQSLIFALTYGQSPKVKDVSKFVLPTDLDSCPFPYREIYNKFPEYANNPVKNVLTARGCPYVCTYCYNSVYRELYKGQKIVRYRSAENVIEECIEVKDKYKAKMIFFADDEFSMNVTRLKQMMKLYKKKVQLPFHCQLRIDILTEERISLLKDAGCKSLTFAIECGNEETRKKLLNRNITDNQIIDGAKLLHKYRIPFRAENMIGLPYETTQDRMKTLNLNIKVKPAYAWCSIFQPYPMTALGEECRKNGLCDESVDIFNEKFSEDSVLKMSLEDKNKLIRFQRLFSLFVEFPVLKLIMPLLLKLASIKLLTKLRDKWKMYCYKNRILQ